MVNQEARAFRTWDVLVALAPHGRIITYEDLAKTLETHPRAVRFALELVQNYCMKYRLPPLTILVVNKQTNEPGAGFIAWNHDNLVEGRAEARSYDWASEPNPFAYASDGTTDDELVNRLLTEPEKSGDVYAKVKVRGAQQVIFRQALLRAYGGRCAFGDVSFLSALDAAHIIPWSQCTSGLKMNPRNGILMLCCYHRLFDLHTLSIDEDYRILFTNRRDSELTEADQLLVASLHSKQISLPKDEALWPDKSLIWKRNSKLDSD